MGRFREAVDFLERGHALGSRQAGWKLPSQELLLQHRRFLELDTRLPAILKGEAKPTDAAERLEFAAICYRKGRHAASARLANEAFAEKPALANDLQVGSRYDAACSASLAGSGVGKDEPMPDEADRARLREQALGWLRADLAAWAKVLEAGNEPDRKQFVARTLAHSERRCRGPGRYPSSSDEGQHWRSCPNKKGEGSGHSGRMSPGSWRRLGRGLRDRGIRFDCRKNVFEGGPRR